ncbi:MAG TPA: class I SAM-dependent methyltransferase [Candidatus Pacearchaeota archaeon]|nr:class I SAM-dependent methyltransferase [Candidatus Pacearchaeota archaeon]HPO75527.1 class I SAM-dependent methyltransferase [Candidatus Pacearchaeota archaeon]
MSSINFQSGIVRFNNLVFGKVIQKNGLQGLFSKINLPQNGYFLEIGSKNGYALPIIQKYFSPKKLIGTDIDENSLKVAKENIIKKELKNIEIKTADAQRLPFQSSIFDTVFMFATLHHIPDWKKAISEVSRVLKEKGYFVFREPLAKFYKIPFTKYFDRPAALFTEEELKNILKFHNFKITYFNWRGFYKNFFHASVEVVCQKC